MSKPLTTYNAAGGNNKLYNLEHLFSLVNNDKGFVKGLIEIFINTIPPLAKEMKDASIKEDWPEVAKIAHKLKPTIETMRIEAIQQQIKVVEDNAKTQTNITLIVQLSHEINEILFNASEELKKELENGF